METLSGVQGIDVKLYESAAEINVEEEGKLAIYLISVLAIGKDFPWDSFDYVLDYDLNTTMKREQLSRSSRLKAHISLRTMAKALPDKQPAPVAKGKHVHAHCIQTFC